jgi:hypothetical protein
MIMLATGLRQQFVNLALSNFHIGGPTEFRGRLYTEPALLRW